jgi:hypothetical protein
MKKISLIFLVLMITGLSCRIFQPADLDATATNVAAKVFATMTADVPVERDTPTLKPTSTSTHTFAPTETILPSSTTANTPEPTSTTAPTLPVVPTFGEISFYNNVDDDPAEKFPVGTTKIIACFKYWNMSPENRITYYWYVNGKEFLSRRKPWTEGKNGVTCYSIVYAGTHGLDAGNWEVKFYIDNEFAQSGKFKIGN